MAGDLRFMPCFPDIVIVSVSDGPVGGWKGLWSQLNNPKVVRDRTYLLLGSS